MRGGELDSSVGRIRRVLPREKMGGFIRGERREMWVHPCEGFIHGEEDEETENILGGKYGRSVDVSEGKK